MTDCIAPGTLWKRHDVSWIDFEYVLILDDTDTPDVDVIYYDDMGPDGPMRLAREVLIKEFERVT